MLFFKPVHILFILSFLSRSLWIVLYVLQFKDFDYPFRIFKLSLEVL